MKYILAIYVTLVFFIGCDLNESKLLKPQIRKDAPPAGVAQLNTAMVAGGNVISLKISPDSSRVVYIADQETDGVFELFSSAVDGSENIKISGNLTPGGNVAGFDITPDSSQVVYLADQIIAGSNELFAVAIDDTFTNTGFQLNNTVTAPKRVASFKIAENSGSVVYSADEHTAGLDNLRSVDITVNNATPVLITSMPDALRTITDYQISDDSTRVVYLADELVNDDFELFSVSIGDIAGKQRLNDDLPAGADVANFKVTPNSKKVVYTANQSFVGITDIYSVNIAISYPSTGFNLSNLTNNTMSVSADYLITPNSTSVVYRADGSAVGIQELFSVDLDGKNNTKISGTNATNGEVSANFVMSADGSKVAFLFNNSVITENFLYLVDKDGSNLVTIRDPSCTNCTVVSYSISDDNRKVVYAGDLRFDGMFEIYSSDAVGGGEVVLNPNMVSGGVAGGVTGFHVIAPDSTTVVFEVDQDVAGMVELFAANINGTSITQVNPSFPDTNRDIANTLYRVSPDGAFIIYVGDIITDNVNEIFSSGTPDLL